MHDNPFSGNPADQKDAALKARLRAMLAEDLDSAEEADALLETVLLLRRWDAAETQTMQIDSLVQQLAAALPSETWFQRLKRGVSQSWPLQVLIAQMRVVRGAIWWASLLVMLIGTLVTLGTYGQNGNTLLPLAVIAPIVTACGVALLYDGETEQMLELENATRVGGVLLLLARLALVFGLNLLLALAGSVLLALTYTEVSLWPLVMSWLAPMTFLSALAFFLSVASIEPLIGASFSLGLWVVHLSLTTQAGDNLLLSLLSLPGLRVAESRPALFLVSALLVIVALWMVGQSEHRIGDQHL
ncbi:MAG: hypothetical protein SF029_10380 [bacterium]|nr:hypothetical protein [bacterium]